MDADEYNYAHFDAYVESGAEEAEFKAFADLLHAGQPAPDLVATRLDDEAEVALSDLWRRQPVVVEFGSFT